MATVHDVAAYVLKRTGRISTMKLQKLVYYSQAWSLVWDEKPLFPEEIQAWANGPVVWELYDKHRGRFSVEEWEWGERSNLTKDERETVKAVISSYGKFTGQQLSDLSHDEGPWQDARKGLPAGSYSSRTISLDSIQAYYSGVSASDDSTEL